MAYQAILMLRGERRVVGKSDAWEGGRSPERGCWPDYADWVEGLFTVFRVGFFPVGDAVGVVVTPLAAEG